MRVRSKSLCESIPGPRTETGGNLVQDGRRQGVFQAFVVVEMKSLEPASGELLKPGSTENRFFDIGPLWVTQY